MANQQTMRFFTAIAFIGLIVAGCGGGGSSSETTTVSNPPETTTTQPTTTTTTSATTTTVGKTPLEYLLELGYTMSEEYVVETVFANIDSATGGLAIDEDGNFFQADFGYSGHPGNSVYRITPDGTVETFVQSDEMDALTMTTFGEDGEMYQSSYGSDKVFRISGGVVELVAEGISGPAGIVALADGTLFVQAYDSGKIHKISPDGTNSEWVKHPDFDGPNGMTLGPDGTIYSVNHKDGGLFAIDRDGTVTPLHEFPWPTSHVAYLDNSLFVTSRGAFVVYRYDLETGTVEIIAGNAEPGDQDGRGSQSSFGRPNAITVGPDGALYINHGTGTTNEPVTIRRITHQP
jgi:ribosomal protein L21E